MPETIIKQRCPKCKTVNYFNMGDPEDMTAYEPDGIECYECGHQRLFDEDSREVVGSENLNYEIGQAEA